MGTCEGIRLMSTINVVLRTLLSFQISLKIYIDTQTHTDQFDFVM